MNDTISALLYSSVPAASITNDEYLFWHPHWVTIRDCLMGEIAIKRRANKYLPKLFTQDADEYTAYLQRVVWHTPSIPLKAVLIAEFDLSAEPGGSAGRASVLE